MERAYRPAPAVLDVAKVGTGGILIAGRADPGTTIRLSSPAGAAWLTQADERGDWRIRARNAAGPQLFGLAMRQGSGWSQASGYLALLPSGESAMLRAGSGALEPGNEAKAALRITAIDFDPPREAAPVAAVVSGTALPNTEIAIAVDGIARARVEAGADGRFEAALDGPIAVGAHQIAARSSGGQSQTRIELDPSAPLGRAPFRARTIPGGWRIDWLTPGGGEQSTLLLTP